MINAVIAPTCMVPRSIFLAATQVIRIDVPFMISIIPGIITAMTRLVNSCVFIRSLFASSKRSSSFFSRPNARITESPVRISRDTRFRRSTSTCIILNLGIATNTRKAIRHKRHATATTMIHPIPELVLITFMTPPTPIIGAYKTIRSIMIVNIWTCWISLVLLVIRDAVENLSISALENPMTFSNTPLRSFRPRSAPTLDANNPTSMDATPKTKAMANILSPAISRYCICIESESIPASS